MRKLQYLLVTENRITQNKMDALQAPVKLTKDRLTA